MLHPSAASDNYRGPGYATKSRDVMGEFIERGIGTILFTHPLDGHDYSIEQLQEMKRFYQCNICQIINEYGI